jgi:hypothetical protein
MFHLRVIAAWAASSFAGWNVVTAFDVDPLSARKREGSAKKGKADPGR